MADIFNLSDTWNDGATTFSAIKMDVTDTASASGSLLMDLQVGGNTQFSVSKTGVLRTGLTIRPTAQTNIGIIFGNGLAAVERADTGAINFSVSATSRTVQLGATASFGWSGTTDSAGSTADIQLSRDAADTLAQRRSTNPQAFRVYNTYTDASNYERGFARWNSNVLEIGAEAAGTGSARSIRLMTNNAILKSAGGSNYAIESGSIIRYASGVDLLWSNNINAHTGITSDVGILRESAGVLKISDGSTGTGQLIFIVPTSDPGISGALWNNGGALAISA